MGEGVGTVCGFYDYQSDNPRYVKPDDIIADIVVGMKRRTGNM